MSGRFDDPDETRATVARPEPSASEPAWADDGDRFVVKGLLGRGGMGVVRLVYDRQLQREAARKELRPDRRDVDRFLREARTTAGLEHPGIVPVYDVGTLPDGRPWYAMQRVHGRTLTEVLHEAHAGPPNLRRLVDLVRRTAEVVAYAHAHGVIHRDLKPDNVLLGAFGEVRVVDWGLATSGEADDGVLGTPTYVAPEVARGAAATPRSDVYCLGGVLYEALTGRPPRRGSTKHVLARARAGARPAAPPTVDADLRAALVRALAPDPADRFADASGLVDELGAWLDGVRRRERALALVAEAAEHAAASTGALAEAEALDAQAHRILDPLAASDPADAKKPGWRLEDRARALREEAALHEQRQLQALHAALRVDPELTEAHAGLADRYRQAHAAAEAARDPSAARLELLLREHDRGAHIAYLRGDGALSLRSDPAGAAVTVAPYGLVDRRLVPGPSRALGETPLDAVALPCGTYEVTLRRDGREARFPVRIRRGEHADFVRPGDATPYAIPLLPPGEPYVPAGWVDHGGDPDAVDALPLRRVWVDGFVLQRDPVTHADYRAFLVALDRAGRSDDADRFTPREGSLVRDGAGWRFGELLEAPVDPRTPIVRIPWFAARAYAAWRAARDDLPWRLPHSVEWEKAARGTDGRIYPWGDHLEPTWAGVVDGFTGSPRPAPADTWPLDVSPYGVRGLTGNVRDWCADAYTRAPPVADGAVLDPTGPDEAEWRCIRGGTVYSGRSLVRTTSRFAATPDRAFAVVGIRLCRSVR